MALREVLDDAIDFDLGEDDAISDDLGARSALIIVQQAEREIEKIKRTRKAVVDSYDARISSIEERAKLFRAKLLDYVLANGNASFPDVGTAYSTKTATKVVIADREKIESEYGALYQTEPRFDDAAFRAYAADHFEKTGEIIEGTDVVRASKTLGIRKS